MGTWFDEETKQYQNFETEVVARLKSIAGAMAAGTGEAAIYTAATQAQEAAAAATAATASAVLYGTAQTLTAAQQEQARGNMGAASEQDPNGEVAIDKSTESNSYIAATVGETISVKNSQTSIVYRKICRVKQNEKYALYVLNDDPAANTGSRVVCITDDEYTVLQKLNISTTAGRWNVLSFTAVGNGWLNVCVDKNYLAIKIRHGDVWEIEKSIAPAEPDKATSAHAIGELIVMNGRLYQVTTPIAAGGTIAGSVAETTVAEQLAVKTIDISGSTPTIAAAPGASYNCIGSGTAAEPVAVTELDFTPSASGICSVRFVSGTTATVLTLPQTVVMPDWWNGVEASRTYEISIADGVYGVVTSWA